VRRWAGVAALAFASIAAADTLDYRAARARAERDEASLTSAQSKVFTPRQGEVIGQAIPACIDPKQGARHVHAAVVLELDAQGRATRTWHEGDDRTTRCFEAQFSRARMAAPPRAPFFTFVELDLDVR
jgi:hypothetical protein